MIKKVIIFRRKKRSYCKMIFMLGVTDLELVELRQLPRKTVLLKYDNQEFEKKHVY